MGVNLIDWMNRGGAGSSGVGVYGAGGGGGAGGAGSYVAVSVDPTGRVINNQAIGRGLRQNGMLHNGIQSTPETKEQKVVRLLKGDFEKYTGMSYAEFEEIKKNLIENHPEKLI